MRAESAWNTWSERLGEMVFLPLGLRVPPVLFSSGSCKATAIHPPGQIRFGRHRLHGEAIDFQPQGGTQLKFSCVKCDPFLIEGGWSVREKREWGLR